MLKSIRPLYLLPLVAFVLIALFFVVGLRLDPTLIPSARIGKEVPAFDLPALHDEAARVTSADLRDGQMKLLNVFAEWCVPCRVEHPLLMSLQQRGVVIYGLNYKDTPENAKRFLRDLGDPYTRIAQDTRGRVGIDLGISGVPETFVVDGEGKILFQHIGPLTRDVVMEHILPLIDGDA